jgi:hypothetical protein
MSMLITGSNEINFEGEDIDLNKIFQLSYNFDLLKNVLGKILTEQKKTKSDINKLNEQNEEKNQKIEK